MENTEIVCFGDSIFGNRVEEPTPAQSIPYALGKALNCTTHNVAFGGCNLVDRGDSTDFKFFSMTALTDAIINNSWTEAEEAANRDVVPAYFKDHLALLKSIDFNKVKVVLINYGTNDFLSRLLDNPANLYDRTTIKGAYRYCLKALATKFPTVTFGLCSIYKCFKFTPDTETATENNKGKNDITRADFNKAIQEVAEEFGALYIDNYNLGVNPYNAPFTFFS